MGPEADTAVILNVAASMQKPHHGHREHHAHHETRRGNSHDEPHASPARRGGRGGVGETACHRGRARCRCSRRHRSSRRKRLKPGNEGAQRGRKLAARLVTLFGLLFEGLGNDVGKRGIERQSADPLVERDRRAVTWSWMYSIGVRASNGSLPVSTS